MYAAPAQATKNAHKTKSVLRQHVSKETASKTQTVPKGKPASKTPARPAQWTQTAIQEPSVKKASAESGADKTKTVLPSRFVTPPPCSAEAASKAATAPTIRFARTTLAAHANRTRSVARAGCASTVSVPQATAEPPKNVPAGRFVDATHAMGVSPTKSVPLPSCV